MATRFSRAPRRRRDTPAPLPTAAGGLLVVLALAVLGWQALRVYNGVPARPYQTFYVSTPEVGNLLSHDQVRIAGARVGQILGRDVGEDGRPRIELQIEPGISLPQDTKVAVRGAGLLGARYVELIPGKATAELAESTTIKGTDGSYTFGLPETLDTFDRETRGRLRTMVGGLGQGFAGRGAGLNDGIHAAGTRAKDFGDAAVEILRREGAPGRLLPALESAITPLDANREDLADLTTQTSDALEPFIDRRDETRATLDEAPPTLATLQPDLRAGTQLLASVRSLAGVANETLPPAPRGLRSLTGLLRDAEKPLDRTADLLDAARPAVPAALKITGAARPLLKPVTDMLGDLSPMLGSVSRYSCDIVNFALTMRSMTGFTQPGSGPHGPAQAFRLQVVAPVSGDVVGLKDTSGRNRRDAGPVTPCTYLAKPYPQFVGGTR